MPQPAKSAKLQLLQKNPNKKNVQELKKRAEAEDRLKMQTNNIRAPEWLDAIGTKTFNFLKKELLSIDILTNADTYHLALYADAYSQYLKYKQIVDENIIDEEGNPNAFIVRMEKAASQMRTFGSDLGLSSSARAKLAIKMADDGGDDDDDF